MDLLGHFIGVHESLLCKLHCFFKVCPRGCSSTSNNFIYIGSNSQNQVNPAEVVSHWVTLTAPLPCLSICCYTGQENILSIMFMCVCVADVSQSERRKKINFHIFPATSQFLLLCIMLLHSQ